MFEEILRKVVGAKTSEDAWTTLKKKFSSSTHARTVQLRINLAYLLVGLPSEYDPYVTSMTTKDSITLDDAYAHLVAFEARQLKHQAALKLNIGSLANYAGRGGPSRGRDHSDRGRGRSRGGAPPCSNGDRRGPSPSCPPCQICGKVGHTAIRCWYRMDASYYEDPPSTAMVATTSKVDVDWYTDTGASDHITSDLDHLALCEHYHINDQVQVGNDSSLPIMHIGHSSINIVDRPLVLHNVLHIPEIAKPLMSVHKFSHDNNIFF
jgi:hypothetical protein